MKIEKERLSHLYYHSLQGAVLAVIIQFTGVNVHATSFTITNGQVVTTLQTLSADNESGLIEVGGKLEVSSSAIIHPMGNNVSIINNGAILASQGGGFGRGIDSRGNNTRITNNGLITMGTGLGVTGIFSSGDDSIITNNGSISLVIGTAVSLLGDRTTFTNNGQISVTTTSNDKFAIVGRGGLSFPSHGISVNLLTNSKITGKISLTTADDILNIHDGSRTVGSISLFGGNDTVSIQDGSQIIGSIDLGSGNDILNINAGSQITGLINLGDGIDTVNLSGLVTTPGISSNLSFPNAEVINIEDSFSGLAVGNMVSTIDPTGQSVNSAVLGSVTSGLHDVINQHMTHHQSSKPIQLASIETTPGMLSQERSPKGWVEVFGSERSRGAEEMVLGYDHHYYGLSGGYESNYGKYRLGLMGGFAKSTVKTEILSIETESESYFIGAYGHLQLEQVNLTAALISGYEDHDNKRFVLDNIIEVAESDYGSIFLSPSITLSTSYAIGSNLELRPLASFIYSVAWYDDYSESGTTQSNLSIGDRTVQAFTGRLQLALARSFGTNAELEIRAGAITRHTDDDDISANLSGTNFTYAAVSDDSVYGGFVGGSLHVSVRDHLDLITDIEYGRASGDEDQISGYLSLEYSF